MKQSRSLFAVFFIIFLDNFGFAVVFTIFPALLLTGNAHIFSPELGEGTRNILFGFLFAIFSLFQFFGAPILGDLADQFGRKRAFFVTVGLTTLGYFFSALAIMGESYTALVISRAFTGFFAGNLSICMACVADMSPDERSRGHNYGLVTTVCGLSWILAMFVGGYLSDPRIASIFSPSFPLWLTGVLSAVNFLVVWKLYDETFEREGELSFDLIKGIHNIRLAIVNKTTRLPYIAYFFWAVSWGLIIQWVVPISLEHYHVDNLIAVWALAFAGVTWSLGGSVVNRWILHFMPSRRAALVGFTITAIFLIASIFSHYYWLFGLLFGLAALSAAFSMSNSINMISLSSEAAVQGKAMGISQSVLSLGLFLGPLIGGAVAKFSIFSILPISAVLFVIGLIVLLSFHAKTVE